MAKPPEPRWDAKRNQWVSRIGAKGAGGLSREVYFDRKIAKNDKAGAWEWMRAYQASNADLAAPMARGTVEEVAERFVESEKRRLADGELSVEHVRQYSRHLGFLTAKLGTKQAGQVEHRELQRLIDAVARKYAPVYTSHIAASIARMFRWARDQGLIAVNPAEGGLKKPVAPRSPERFAERAEAAAWIAWCRSREIAAFPKRRDHARQFTLIQRCLIRSGARPKELCQSRWEDVVWEWGRTDEGQGSHAFAMILLPADRWKAGKKTGRERRIVLTPGLTRALRRERAKRPNDIHIFTHGHGRAGKGKDEPWKDGSVLSKRVLRLRREAVAEYERRARTGEPTRGLNLIQGEGANAVTNYRWRHTAASTLHALGLPLHDIAELLGTSVQMLVTVYLHITDSHLQEVSRRALKR